MYTNLQTVQPFGETGRYAADLLCALLDVYSSIRALFGKFAAFLVAFFSVIFLRIILWYLIRLLKKNLSTNFNVTPDNYKDLKNNQIVLRSKIKHLARIKQVNVEKAPFLLRGMFRQVMAVFAIIEEYHIALSNQLSKLDDLNTGNANFKVVKEDELWAKRTSHYAYRF